MICRFRELLPQYMKGINMKKAGILTFHYAVNYGAALQCYALKKKAEALGDISAEVINFIPPGWKPASGTTNEKTGKFNR